MFLCLFPYTRPKTICQFAQMSEDFGMRDGVTGGAVSFSDVWKQMTAFATEHIGVMVALFIVLVILVIALFFGWVGTYYTKTGEGMSCSTPGNQSPMCAQIRDGAGESLTNSALLQGYGADPRAFCRTAGADSADPQDYLRQSLEKDESLTMLSPQDAIDRNLMIAMRH